MGAGYLHRRYAESFSHLGAPFRLAACDGWLLERAIPDSPLRDLAGCYPVFSCRDWSRLGEDVASIGGDAVALTLVTDAFSPLSEADLQAHFAIVRLLNMHYVVDLSRDPRSGMSSHHARALRAASRRSLDVGIVEGAGGFLEEWWPLYANLIARHDIGGIRRFSRETLAVQLEVPGAVIFTAREHGVLVGADWYYHVGERVYGHLAAFTERGYAVAASYLLQAEAIRYFRGRAAQMDIGGAPLISPDGGRGLAEFKAGWGARTAPAWLCGRVLDQRAYQSLPGGSGHEGAGFFPFYRRGEYG